MLDMSGSETVTVTMSLQFISGRQSDDLILAEPTAHFVMETTRHNNKIFDPRLAQTAELYPPPVTALNKSEKNHSSILWVLVLVPRSVRFRDKNVLTREREGESVCSILAFFSSVLTDVVEDEIITRLGVLGNSPVQF